MTIVNLSARRNSILSQSMGPLYTFGLAKATRKMFSIKGRLLGAIERDEFELVYQPQTELNGGQVVGVEALLRWRTLDYGLIYPDQFIPMIEEHGLMSQLGNLVIEKACKQIYKWGSENSSKVRVAVNISAMQLQNYEIINFVEKCIEKYDINPSSLEFELTESSLVKDLALASELLSRFKELGIRTAIDDFGTGHSSLNYLANLPFDMIKIDRCFISRLGVCATSSTIIESVIDLSKKLNMQVLAEGVETESQREYLMLYKCDLIQGDLVSEPVSADSLHTISGLRLC